MRIDKNFCMSSYLTFRYVCEKDICFKEGVIHDDHEPIQEDEKTLCKTASDIDNEIKNILSKIDLSKAAILLSGGMDSAILASYLPPGTRAYTARCIGCGAIDETEQARKYCEYNQLKHIVVDVSWQDYSDTMDELMLRDGTPIIPNEPQAYKLARRAKEDGAEIIIYGDCADTEFGGMDKLLSRDWTMDEWIERYSFVDVKKILYHPVDMRFFYEKYKIGKEGIDFVKFIREPYALTAAGALTNAFKNVGIEYVDPYERMKMEDELDLYRVRNGESKYLIRELFAMRYPGMEIPSKIPMSRPAEDWMKDWTGPVRKEFRDDCIEGLTGEQKLLVYSLERFLDLIGV